MYGMLGPAIFDPAPDVVTGVRDFFAGAAENLEETGWQDACPIATVALEVASTRSRCGVATADVFTAGSTAWRRASPRRASRSAGRGSWRSR